MIGLAIVGVVEVEDEVEDELGLVEAMERKL